MRLQPFRMAERDCRGAERACKRRTIAVVVPRSTQQCNGPIPLARRASVQPAAEPMEHLGERMRTIRSLCPRQRMQSVISPTPANRRPELRRSSFGWSVWRGAEVQTAIIGGASRTRKEVVGSALSAIPRRDLACDRWQRQKDACCRPARTSQPAEIAATAAKSAASAGPFLPIIGRRQTMTDLPPP